MSVFLDTSAFYALLDAKDANHEQAKDIWRSLAASASAMVCTNYILLETIALLQNRLGMSAIRTFQEDIAPIAEVHWLGADDHSAAMQALLTADRRRLSLVDCASFETMRRLGIRKVFTFDRHFAEQGFESLP